MALQDYLTLVFHSGDREATQSTWERTCSRAMRQPGCKPGRRSADFRMEGSKPTHGKGNRVSHPKPLSEKSGVGSPAKAREGNRVLHTSKEVGIAYESARAKPLFLHRQETAELSPCGMPRHQAASALHRSLSHLRQQYSGVDLFRPWQLHSE